MTDPRDTRSIELEVEVPGTPEQVWEAIATGPGISAWFVPSDVEGREGGTVAMHHGAGYEETGTVTAWDPPRRFAFDSSFRPSEHVPERTIALELLVEARSGGTCVVRLVNSGFGPEADWDEQLDSTRTGWEMCLRLLRLYLERFPGQPGTQIRAFGAMAGPVEKGWPAFAEAVGLGAPAAGDRVRIAAPRTPALAGAVEDAGDATLTLVFDEPAPGIGSVAAGGPRDPVYVAITATLFGDDATEVAARAQEAWQAWMDAHFPLEAPTTAG